MIYDINNNEITNPDLSKGHLVPDKMTVHHEAVEAVEEVSHLEVVKEYANGGKDLRMVIDVPAIEGSPEYDEEVEIQRYIEFTEDEITVMTEQATKPTTEERLSALESAMLDMMMGV